MGVEIPSILWKVPALTILSDLALREVVVAWRAVIGTNNPVSAGQLKQKAFDSGGDDLLKAISAVACAAGRTEIDGLRLGKWLGRHKGRVVNGIKLHGKPDTDSKQMQWWLERVKKRVAWLLVIRVSFAIALRVTVSQATL